MMTVENRVGRRCEALFVLPFALSDVVALTASIRKILAAIEPAQRFSTK